MIGGYAVGYYGYPRATGDMDVWIAFNPNNIRAVAEALREFGFAIPDPTESFLSEGQFIGIGNSPLRIEVLTSISGSILLSATRRGPKMLLMVSK